MVYTKGWGHVGQCFLIGIKLILWKSISYALYLWIFVVQGFYLEKKKMNYTIIIHFL